MGSTGSKFGRRVKIVRRRSSKMTARDKPDSKPPGKPDKPPGKPVEEPFDICSPPEVEITGTLRVTGDVEVK